MLQDVTPDSTQLVDLPTVEDVPSLLERALSIATYESFLIVVLRILVILILARLLLFVIDRMMSRWAKRYAETAALDPSRQRAMTMEGLVRSSARYVVWPVAMIMIMSAFKIDVAALLATAGIASLAIGFGAQTLVKDVIAGVFLLFDGTVAVGDRVGMANTYGIVEHIGVRLIKVRKYDGELLMVPAGELRIFGNTSIGFSRGIVDVGIEYRQDVKEVMAILDQLGREWIEANPDFVLAPEPEVLSIMAFDDSSVRVRVAIMVKPGEQFRAERELKTRIKEVFDEKGIEIPFPQRTIHLADSKFADALRS